MRQAIHTDKAPQAIGSYSQAIQMDKFIFLSGQIPLDPATMQLVSGDITAQTKQVFENMQAVAEASKVELKDIVKLTVYLININDVAVVNEMIAEYIPKPFPARTTIQVSALPKNSLIEIEAIIVKP